tara:strand:+ start:347 stop:541 length:195 start_codon:yes stop_codon:yes gene_type:complete
MTEKEYHLIRKAGAEVFACDNYNIPREEFVDKCAMKYLLDADAKYFTIALNTYDTIQQDMKEVA